MYVKLLYLILFSATIISCSSAVDSTKSGSKVPNWFEMVSSKEAGRLVSLNSDKYLMQYLDFYPDRNKAKYNILKEFGTKIGNYAGVIEIINVNNADLMSSFHKAQLSLRTHYEAYDSPFIIVYNKGNITNIYSFSEITEACMSEYLDRVSKKIFQKEPAANIFEDDFLYLINKNTLCSILENDDIVVFAKYIFEKYIELNK